MIFRFNFEEGFAEELFSFAKINQYLERQDYKEKWDEWVLENIEKIAAETRRLESLGYKGNVEEKMFKSARYYFRTKTSSEPKKRKPYLPQDKAILQEIDDFIYQDMKTADFIPKSSFLKWCANDPENLELKKTFKNRYYLAKNK